MCFVLGVALLVSSAGTCMSTPELCFYWPIERDTADLRPPFLSTPTFYSVFSNVKGCRMVRHHN